MGQIAVDVVLLPDEAMMRQAIEINRRLVPNGPQEIVLSWEDHRPHISLAMGCIEEADVPATQTRLEDLAHNATVRRLRVVGVVSSVSLRGETTSLLDVEKTEELQALHERVLEEMEPFFRHDVTEAMIYDEVVSPSTLEWIRTYPQKSSYENFHPHITLGYGRLPSGLSFPIQFTVRQLAVCHLGNHCTCRKILAAADVAWASRP